MLVLESGHWTDPDVEGDRLRQAAD